MYIQKGMENKLVRHKGWGQSIYVHILYVGEENFFGVINDDDPESYDKPEEEIFYKYGDWEYYERD